MDSVKSGQVRLAHVKIRNRKERKLIMAVFLRMFMFFMAFSFVPSLNKYMIKSMIAKELYKTRIETGQVTPVDPQPTPSEKQRTIKISQEINNKNRPEVIRVTIEDKGPNQDLGESASIRDTYEIDYMASGVVGLVGVPVRVAFDSEAKPRLTFTYDVNELRGIPERNLIILHEDPEGGSYVQVGQETIEYNAHTVSVDIPETGTYLLADCYQWYTVWGVDMSEYAYDVDPSEVISNWERECDTGSIMELVDRQWAMANAPVFHVSTPEQLASVVYYNNAIERYDLGSDGLYLYLEEDIDLAGYDWVPMGWLGPQSNAFNGTVDGQGHKISNMSIKTPYNNHCAFIGYSTGVEVRNITFENAYVEGGYYAGIVGGEIYMSKEWENVRVSGVIADASGEVGSIIGREAYLHFKNCEADVISKKSGSSETRLEYFSHRQEVIANTPATEDFQLIKNTDGSVTRTESDKDFMNLCWHLEADGVQLLQRGADDELTYDPNGIFYTYKQEGRQCLMWLEAYTGETYTRVSNILEY